MAVRLFIHFQKHVSEAAFPIGGRFFQRALDIAFLQFSEFEHAAARHDGGSHGRVGIFRSRAYEHNIPAFDIRKQGIRLRFIETVAFVEQQIGAFTVKFQIAARLFRRRLHVRNARVHGVQLYVIAPRRIRHDIGERGLARARRAPEDTATQPVGFDGARQKAGFRNDMRLADKFPERTRPHAFGERMQGVFIELRIVIE